MHIICQQRENAIRWDVIVRQRMWKQTRTNNVPSMGPLIMYLIRMERLGNPHVGKTWKKYSGDGHV
jgi:hypothetical protein